MDFDLNDEQRQLKDSLDRLLADTYGDLNKRHGYMKEPKGYSACGSSTRTSVCWPCRSPRRTAAWARGSPRP